MNEWISILEQQPKVDQNVLCYSDYYGVHEAIVRQGRYGLLFLDPNEEYFEFSYVTHWMKMPAPPKGD